MTEEGRGWRTRQQRNLPCPALRKTPNPQAGIERKREPARASDFWRLQGGKLSAQRLSEKGEFSPNKGIDVAVCRANPNPVQKHEQKRRIVLTLFWTSRG
jgi:hypothetical protein